MYTLEELIETLQALKNRHGNMQVQYSYPSEGEREVAYNVVIELINGMIVVRLY